MGGFSAYFYQDNYQEEKLKRMGLNERQIKAVMYIKENGKITNREFQDINLVSKRTATRDLDDLFRKEILEQLGTTGKGTEYILKGVKGVKGVIKGSQRGHKGTKRGSQSNKLA